MKGYVVLFLLPLPKKNLAEYKKLARKFGRVAIDHGALHYREFIGVELKPKHAPSFTKVLPLKRGEAAITSVLEFKSRKHGEKTMLAMFHDPRMEKMMKEKPLFDMKKMYWAGFETIVEAK